MRCLPKIVLSIVIFSAPSVAFSNGFGEARGWQFRTPSDRQVLINQEQVRLQFMGSAASSVGAAGVGQTGNQTSITITGNGDNTITLTQDNAGDQSIVDVEGDGNSTNGPGGSSTAPPSAVVSSAAAALNGL